MSDFDKYNDMLLDDYLNQDDIQADLDDYADEIRDFRKDYYGEES